MSRIAYRDVCGFDRLYAEARRVRVRADDLEAWACELHNALVWKMYRPREDPDRDEVVCRVIEAACEAKGTRPEMVKDPDVAALVAALEIGG